MLQEDLSDVFVLPLSIQAYDELTDLQNDHLASSDYDDAILDSWTLIWGPNTHLNTFTITLLVVWIPPF